MQIHDAAAASLAFTFGYLASWAIVLTQRWHGRISHDSMVGAQKFHTAPTPRIGGVAILFALAAAQAFPASTAGLVGPMLIAAAPAFAAGLLEDLTKKVGVLQRLVATVSCGVIAWYLSGAVVRHTGIAGMDAVLAHTPAAVLFTAVAVGGMANAVNIIDGFNGLAGGVVIIMLSSLGLIAWRVGDPQLASVCLLLAACTAGFLAVNWPSGRIFLGDGGAYLLGFLVAWVAVMLLARNPGVPAWAPLLACAYPVLEVGFSFYRKSKREGYNPCQPDRVHLHMLVHRRVVRHRLAGRAPFLQNAMTSPFAWLFAGVTSVWAVMFAHDAWWLAVGLLLAAVAYARVYIRLTRFRWWPASFTGVRPPRAVSRAPSR